MLESALCLGILGHCPNNPGLSLDIIISKSPYTICPLSGFLPGKANFCIIFMPQIRYPFLQKIFSASQPQTLGPCSTFIFITHLMASNNVYYFNSSGDRSKMIFSGLKSRCQQSWFLLETLGSNMFSCLFYNTF